MDPCLVLLFNGCARFVVLSIIYIYISDNKNR